MLLLLLFSCGPKAPLELVNPYENPHPSCDPNTHFFAKGIGNTPDEAIANGKQGISSQIASDLKATTSQRSNTIRSSVTQGKYEERMVAYEKQLVSNIQSSTSFQYADLMKIVIPPQEIEQQMHTLLCLNRSEAAGVILHEIESDLKAFETIVANAMKIIGEPYTPVQKENIAGFTTLFNKAMGLHKKLHTDLYTIQSLLGGLDPQQQAFDQQWIMIKNRAIEVVQATVIALSLHSLEVNPDEQLLVQEVIRSSMSDTGLRIIDGNVCNATTTHVANVELFDHCKTPQQTFGMGYMCTPILKIQVTECISNIPTTISLSDKKIKGQDYYTSEKALSTALKKLDGESFMDLFAQELGAVIPLRFE